MKKIIAIFMFLLFISLALRLIQLNSGLWLDEITTYVTYTRLPFREIVTLFDSENQHFLYSLLGRLSILVFGESNWALRLPAVLFGIASISALFGFGLLVTSPTQALLAASLMAFSYHHVWFSQNARGYTGLLFWTLLSSIFMLMAMRSGKWTHWIFFGIASALGAYTHLTMLFFVAGQFIVFGLDYLFRPAYRTKKFLFNGLFGFGTASGLTLLLYIPVIGQMQTVIGGTEVSVVEAWKSPLWTILEFLSGMEIGFSSLVAAGIAFVMLMVGIWSYLRSYPEVVGFFIIPPVLGATITLAIGHHLWPRFFFFAFGFGALIVIRGILECVNWLGKSFHLSEVKTNRIGIGLSIGLIILSSLSIPFAYGPKQDFEGAQSFVQSETAPGDRVVTVSIAAYVYDKYLQTDWIPINTLEQLDAIQTNAKGTWLVYTFPEVVEAVNPDIMAKIQSDFEKIAEYPGTVRSGTIYIVKGN